MTIPNKMFDDPRARPRRNENDKRPPLPEVEELPEAEYDWYLKRKPAVSYILNSKKNVPAKQEHI